MIEIDLASLLVVTADFWSLVVELPGNAYLLIGGLRLLSKRQLGDRRSDPQTTPRLAASILTAPHLMPGPAGLFNPNSARVSMANLLC